MSFSSKAAWSIARNAIFKEKTAHNVVVSPFGFDAVSMLFKFLTEEPTSDRARPAAMAAEDCIRRRADGTTLGCAIKALHDKGLPFQPYFRRLVTQLYTSTAFDEVDFQFGDHSAIVGDVNSWVKKNTNGLLSKIADNDDVDFLSRLMFMNTWYFKGTFCDPFDPDLTVVRDFHLLDGKTIKVPFMTGCEHYYHGKFDNFDVIRIPFYRTGVMSLCIFLPNEPGSQEFQPFLHDFDSEDFLLQDLKLMRTSDRDLLIPKFDIQYKTADFSDVFSGTVKTSIRKELLKADKIIRPQSADSDDEGLFLGKILQNSVIKVGEAGAEAASATSMSICGASPNAPPPSRPSPPSPSLPVVVDRPFLFHIREDELQLTFFHGVVTNPLA